LETNQNNLTKKFSSSFRWNIAGSISYESIKILHQVFLLKTMESSSYGLMGSIFSIIYLTVYLSEFGFGATLPPFLNTFTQSKNNFKNIFIKYYFLPQFLLIFTGASIATLLYSKSFLCNRFSPFSFLIPLIIIFESIRIFFRRFLHTVFISKPTVIIETVLVLIYIFVVWIPYLFFNFRMTQNLVFVPYLLDSVLGVSTFTFLVFRFYKTLPEKPLSAPKNLWKRIIKTRFFNYSIQVGKNLFTGNFLTPFFATSFGLKEAGVFNLANHIAESIKAMMKVTIIFSGNALLAKLKSTSITIKRQAFKLLGEKLNKVIYPLIIFLIINYRTLLNLRGISDIKSSTLTLALTFLLITFMEYFFLVYEQFYIVEERANKLFIFKFLEFTLFYSLIISKIFSSPIITLLGIVVIRFLSFAIIATNAYSLWKVKPNFRINYRYLFGCVTFSLLFYFLFR